MNLTKAKIDPDLKTNKQEVIMIIDIDDKFPGVDKNLIDLFKKHNFSIKTIMFNTGDGFWLLPHTGTYNDCVKKNYILLFEEDNYPQSQYEYLGDLCSLNEVLVKLERFLNSKLTFTEYQEKLNKVKILK